MTPHESEGGSIGLSGLPEPVRRRVLALVAEALPRVVPLPPSLQKVAAFAPARRGRAGATLIEAALADDDLRARVATQVRAGRPLPDVSAGSHEGDPGDAGDLVERAADCWLQRPEGWRETLAGALAGLGAGVWAVDDRDVLRLREQVARLEAAARDVRTEHRDRLRILKEENADLRRKLGETRTDLRRIRSELASSGTAEEAVRQGAELASRQAEVELRRLRAQVEQLTRELQKTRREGRTERDEATVRARLLLDTVVEAATGLRRELGLPVVEGVPADAVRLEEPHGPAPVVARPAETPASLERLLALPRARLLVDGYNVSKTAWASSSLEVQRVRLLQALAPLAARTGAETTVVFDAHEAESRPVVGVPRGVKVVYSPRGVIADDVLRRFVAAEPAGRPVVVVTSDRALGDDVRAGGARVVPASTLAALLG